ncbi:efflux RND transporter permease subunit [Octadecabacter sp. 1_MG-2023]|uniref:efflux RND transporter permease subunit n=1 Tax=unclassified Octadecabacter TaxID=196158 RepID=UPI001C0A3604|nr:MULTISPECIES: efflux RND transporter permease subunit [unclassified Octadecabacter]MBU2994776.1 efflux RND transporter permease subunit [Octadecabacter sp. B2R22]MDO6733930.1 efflux RND transporter permease subunit [Octadecabacter sp. 1_MG-2023]
MDIARLSINRPIYTWIVMLICLLGGLWGFNSLGRLEDPAFTIKTAIVVTQYPGASAQEVALEVSEPIESQIQKMGEVDDIQTMNQPGLSWITVNMRDQYDGTELPEIWTKLRNRVGDASLPSGTSTPFVNDNFGDVYGMYYAVTATGYTDAEINNLSTYLRRELLSVDGVSDVSLSGVPNEVIYIEPEMALLTNMGIPPAAIVSAISGANEVVDGGTIQNTEGRTIIQRPDGSDSVSEIASLSIGVGGEVVNLSNFADVFRGGEANPDLIVRHNGVEAFTLGVAGIASENIVEVGKRVDAHLDILRAEIPLGISIEPIYQQHVVVEEASNAFLINLAMSVAIVVIVLAIFMGWRAAVVVGSTLFLTVLGTLFFMALGSIEMERISLGALIIAMGMLVDNAIVVAEGMQISMHRGRNSRDAATEAASKTQIPLLGATVIGIMAFAGIGLSPDATGEFLFSLFAVIAISLLLSWVLALTVTPLLGHFFFKQGDDLQSGGYDGALFKGYAAVLRACIKLRWIVIAGLIGTTVVCFALFGQIKQQFFPDSNTPLYFVHYKLPQGASIGQTSDDMAVLENWLSTREDVTATSAFIGMGASRFMLTYDSEDPNPGYGHLIVRVTSLDVIEDEMNELEAFALSAVPQGEFRVKRLAFGPGGGAPIEVRFSGSDPDVLRNLADEAIARLSGASENIVAPRHDWRERELILRPIYSEDRAQDAGVSRSDITQTLQFAVEGLAAGTFREGDRQIPITVRVPRDSDLSLADQVIYSDSAGGYVSMEQVTDGFVFEPQDTLLLRRDRADVITVGADIPRDMTASEVLAEVRDVIEDMTIPSGYTMEWGGELESSSDAQASLAGQLPFSIIIMVLISVLLFNALRQPIIIWLLVPMAVNGVSLGLLGAGLPFTFTALLGLLSLSGMLIKNGIVLIEEIDLTREAEPELPLTDAIVTASTSRLRPVFLAAATTILGMLPLISDAFFQSMAVTIMGGLAFASVLTLIAAPVLYYIFFKRSAERDLAAA